MDHDHRIIPRLGEIGSRERLIGGIGRSFGLGDLQYEAGPENRAFRIRHGDFGRVLGHLKPFWKFGLGVALGVGVTGVLNLMPPQIVRFIIDRAIPGKDVKLLTLLVAAMVGLPVVSGFVRVLQDYLTIRVGQGLMYDLRNALYRHLQTLSLGFYTATRSGEIISRISNDVAAIRDVVRTTFVGILTNAVTVVATLVVIFSMNWRLACLAVAVLPLFIIPTRRVGRLRQRVCGRSRLDGGLRPHL